MNTIQIATERSTDRGPSPALWDKCPWRDIQEGVRLGYANHFEFADLRLSSGIGAAEAYWASGYNVFGSTGATIALLDAVGGGASFASDGDDEGAGIRDAQPRFQLDQDKAALWFEACLQTSTVADTKHGFVLGLGDSTAITATSPITAAGALADLNFVGFHRLEGDGDQLDVVYKANGVTKVDVDTDVLDGSTIRGGTLPSALTAATDIKLGMKYTPRGDRDGNYCLSFWVNGIRLPNSKLIPTADGTDFPNDVRLGRLFSVLNATASTPGSTTMKWWRIAQLFEPVV